jgi:hypothetical protein
VFGVVGVEHRVRQDGVGAQQGFRQVAAGRQRSARRCFDVGCDAGNQLDQRGDIGARGLFVECEMPSTPVVT